MNIIDHQVSRVEDGLGGCNISHWGRDDGHRHCLGGSYHCVSSDRFAVYDIVGDKNDDTSGDGIGDDDTDDDDTDDGQVNIDSDGKPKCRLGVGFLQVEKSYTDEVQKWRKILTSIVW